VLNEVKPNVCTVKYACQSVLWLSHILVYPALAGAITLACWASLRSAPTYKSRYLNPAAAGAHQRITLGDNAPSDFTCKNADPRVGIFKKLAVGRTVWEMVALYRRAIYPPCPPHRQVWPAVCHTRPQGGSHLPPALCAGWRCAPPWPPASETARAENSRAGR